MCKNPLYSLRNQSGFMTAGGHLLGMIFMGLTLPAVLILAKGYFYSLGTAFIALGILFIPIFIVTHAIADFIDHLTEHFPSHTFPY